MKKIGIFTQPLSINYGGILQAYALQKTLKNMGYDVVTINSKFERKIEPAYRKPLVYSKRLIKILLKKEKLFFLEEKINTERPIIAQHCTQFINRYINTKEIESIHDLKNDDFDILLVGSDQVWRPQYAWKKNIRYAFLDFAKNWNVKRIAYAASFGTDNWEFSNKETKDCCELLKMFDAVSVREETGIRLCDEYLNYKEAKHVLDPTMLLNAEDYIELINAYNFEKDNKGIMAYILDDSASKMRIIEHIEKIYHKDTFYTNSKIIDFNLSLEERIQKPVENWLKGFVDSDFIFTDSFHGCVFSIIFKKQFIVYGNSARGMARFNSLLKMFKLENRLVTKETNMDEIEEIIKNKIDYDKVYNILKSKREESLNFLKDALSGADISE